MSTKQKTNSESTKSQEADHDVPSSGFWTGFNTRRDEQGGNPLPSHVSIAGPKLDTITEETDRGKFRG